MDWSSNYTTSWQVVRIDPDTWTETQDVLENVTAVSVKKDGSGSAPKIEASSMTVVSENGEAFEHGWYRILMYTNQDGSRERWPIATCLYESDDGEDSKGVTVWNVEGYSVLQPCEDMKVSVGTFVPKGANVISYVERLLRESTPAPVKASGEFALEDYLVFDEGTSYLECIWMLLDAGNFVIQIEGDGTIDVLEAPSDPKLDLDEDLKNGVRGAVSHKLDISSIPNRYTAIEGDESVTVINDQENSAMSVSARGRYIDVIDTSPSRMNGESLETYAERKLKKASTVYRNYTYDRDYHPDIRPYDLIRGTIVDPTMRESLRVMSQSLTLNRGAYLSETAGVKVEGYLS